MSHNMPKKMSNFPKKTQKNMFYNIKNEKKRH